MFPRSRSQAGGGSYTAARMPLPSLTVIGPGRAGRAFARSWTAAAGHVDAVLGRNDPASRIASDVLVLAVPDDRVAVVATSIAPAVHSRYAYHLSGALGSDVLEPIRRGGSLVGSFHPLRAFRGEENETLDGAFVAIEGDAEACDAADGYARALGADPHRISPDAKPLYHAGATMAAGGSVALLSAAARAWAAAGIPEGVARSALARLAQDAIAGVPAANFADVFTGPVARRDVGTIRAHLAALDASPDARRLYVLLARETLARTPGGEPAQDEELRALLTC